ILVREFLGRSHLNQPAAIPARLRSLRPTHRRRRPAAFAVKGERASMVDWNKTPRADPAPAGMRYKAWYPQSEVEVHQEAEGDWQLLPADMVAFLRGPLEPQLPGESPLYNGVVGSCFPVTVGTTQSILALIENSKRAYLII